MNDLDNGTNGIQTVDDGSLSENAQQLLEWLADRAAKEIETTCRDVHRSLDSYSNGRKCSVESVLDSLVKSGDISITRTATGGRPKDLITLISQTKAASVVLSEPDVSEMISSTPTVESEVLSKPESAPEAKSVPARYGPFRLLCDAPAYRLSRTFKCGEVIGDRQICKSLYEAGIPVARSDEPNKVMCPAKKCQHIWDSSAVDLSGAALVWTQDCRTLVTLEGLTTKLPIQRRSGDIDAAPHLVSGLKKQPGLPVRRPSPDDCTICPKCQGVYSRSLLLGDELALLERRIS